MTTHETNASLVPLRDMGRLRAFLLKIFGPADSWDNPLIGTRFDPQVRQHRDQADQAARRAHRTERRLSRAGRGVDRTQAPHHYLPDE
jgi:hypothetical protein